jgi:hypothetical protein
MGIGWLGGEERIKIDERYLHYEFLSNILSPLPFPPIKIY